MLFPRKLLTIKILCLWILKSVLGLKQIWCQVLNYQTFISLQIYILIIKGNCLNTSQTFSPTLLFIYLNLQITCQVFYLDLGEPFSYQKFTEVKFKSVLGLNWKFGYSIFEETRQGENGWIAYFELLVSNPCN